MKLFTTLVASLLASEEHCQSGWTLFELGGQNYCWKSLGSQRGDQAKDLCAAEGARVPLPERLGKRNFQFLCHTVYLIIPIFPK